MSEAVREMTREELIAERDKYRAEADRQYRNKCKLECQIKEMQSHIDCLKAELAEVQKNKQELPLEPIKVAEMLIYATGADCDIYSKSDLKQIAAHLLVYCNNVEVE